MAMIPPEIILEEILPRLPATSLLRFKCVSKYFKTLISSPKFTSLHLRHSLSSDANRLLIINLGAANSGLHSIDLDSPENPPKPLPLPDPVNSIVGSCNGLLLIRSSRHNSKLAQLLLINPSTGFYSVIAPSLFENYGFGYDGVTGNYKVLGIAIGTLMVYNSTGIEWRGVAIDEYINSNIIENGKFGVPLHQHLCHWLLWCRLQKKHRIVCFDFCSETWTRDVPLPNNDGSDIGSGPGLHFADHLFETCRDKRGDVTNLGVFDGCLSVLTMNTGHAGLDVWVMKEYGVAESWVKLFRVPDQQFTPLAYARGSSSKVLLHKKDQLIWYNIRNKQSEEAEIHDVHGVHAVGHLYEACVVKGSLVTVPDGIWSTVRMEKVTGEGHLQSLQL